MTTDQKNVVILGGGVAGLAMGYFLCRRGKYAVTVLEQAPTTGGLCASFEYNGFILDHGAHKLYSAIPGILEEIRALMGDRLLKLPKKNRIYLKGNLLDYPLQFGNLFQALGAGMFVNLGFGYAASMIRGMFARTPPRSYEEYMIKYFGAPTYQLVFEPLADKVWGNPSGLHPEMARTRVPSSNGLEVIFKLLGLKKERKDTNAEFFYYPRKGFGDWPQMLREHIESMGGKVIVNAGIKHFEKRDHKVSSVTSAVNGSVQNFPCDYLISSIPLSALSRYIFPDAANFSHQVDTLQFRHLLLVYLFINRPLALKDQWIFFPERDFVFSRIFEQKQMNPELGPKDQTVVCCDFTCTEDSWQWKADDAVLAQKCIKGLENAGFIKAEEVTGHLIKRTRNFYPRYDTEYIEKMQRVNEQLKQVENLLLTGRLGMYNYNNSDHCFDMAKFISERLDQGMRPAEIWSRLEDRVGTYKIVD